MSVFAARDRDDSSTSQLAYFAETRACFCALLGVEDLLCVGKPRRRLVCVRS